MTTIQFTLTNMIKKIVSRMIIGWMIIIVITICGLYNQMNKTGTNFYRFGPHDDFLVIGIKINTPIKYGVVIAFCFVNSLMRNLVHNILNPWMINIVQDVKVNKPMNIKWFAYEATYVIAIYNWVDWYIYMNLLLAQVDMFMTEMIADLIMSGTVTYYYLRFNAANNDLEMTPIVCNPLLAEIV